MDTTAALLLVSAVLAFVVGFCIQRASVCAVRATEQWVYHRRTSRLRAFFSAAAWSGLVILPLAWLVPGSAMLAEDAPVTWTVLVGGALFGIGAALNGACALGTVAQLTRGRTDYLATLAGITLGAMAAIRIGVHSEATIPSILSKPNWLGLAALVAFGAVAVPVIQHMRRIGQSPRLRLTTVLSFAVTRRLWGHPDWNRRCLELYVAPRRCGRTRHRSGPSPVLHGRARLYRGASRRRDQRGDPSAALQVDSAKRLAMRRKTGRRHDNGRCGNDDPGRQRYAAAVGPPIPERQRLGSVCCHDGGAVGIAFAPTRP